MSNIVNLRRARKQAERREADGQAALNRQYHGRSKATQNLEAERRHKASRNLDQHRIEMGDDR